MPRQRRANPPGMKFCPDCKETKPLMDFSLATKSWDGRGTYCRPCRQVRAAKRSKEYRREWYQQNKDRIREQYNPKTQRARKLKSLYRISEVDYSQMNEKQNGACAICKNPPKPGKDNRGKWQDTAFLNVDHSHSTGKVRGLLCSRCNKLLGAVEDSVEILRNAVVYLEGN